MALCKGAVAWDDLAERESPVHLKPCLSLFVVLAWWFVAVAWCLLAALSPLSAPDGLLHRGWVGGGGMVEVLGGRKNGWARWALGLRVWGLAC